MAAEVHEVVGGRLGGGGSCAAGADVEGGGAASGVRSADFEIAARAGEDDLANVATAGANIDGVRIEGGQTGAQLEGVDLSDPAVEGRANSHANRAGGEGRGSDRVGDHRGG